MSYARDKYNVLRNHIANGAVAICRGKHLLAKTIQYADSDRPGIFIPKKDWAWSNHSMLLYWEETAGRKRLYSCHSNADGVDPSFASNALSKYEDFRILNPGEKFYSAWVEMAVNKTLEQSEDEKIGYDFNLLPKVLLAKRLGFSIKREIPDNVSICSMYTGHRYAKELGMQSWFKIAEQNKFFTPQDHLRYNDGSMVELKIKK